MNREKITKKKRAILGSLLLLEYIKKYSLLVEQRIEQQNFLRSTFTKNFREK
jgi:hypothetical protein